MNAPDASSNARRNRERFWVILVIVLIVFFGFLEGWFFELQSQMPLTGNIFIFGLINLNVILLLLLAYLVLRNIVKLIFERKRNILGHKLRTRLVIAFVGLTLIPTVPLFWLTTQFIFSSLDYWFSRDVEKSLEQSVSLAKDYLDQGQWALVFDLRLLKRELIRQAATTGQSVENAQAIASDMLGQYHLGALLFVDDNGKILWQVQSAKFPKVEPASLSAFLRSSTKKTREMQTVTLEDKNEGLVAHLPMPISDSARSAEIVGIRVLPSHIPDRLATIGSGYEDYLQLKMLQVPLERSNFITFCIVTLLVIFGAIWFGFFLAKNITVPIQAMVSATQQVADGDLNVQLASDRQDEIGMLIASFNKMVRDLSEGRDQLDSAYAALQQNHEELEDRRRYMEIVLRNIAAGVVSVDASGRIITMNKSAEAVFGLQAEQTRGRHYSEVMQPAHIDIVTAFMESYRVSGHAYLEQQVHVMIGNRPLVLLVKASILRDERDQFMGVVVVLDDLTELEKAQRMAAWREVARRIAHEIKNPLTPIQLSAQRLRRKYGNMLEAGESVFDECTLTIVQQVDHMKHLVNEFSRFARLPRSQPIPSDLAAIVEESLTLYRHTYPQVHFSLTQRDELPLLRLDRDQFKQVMLNLFDNALHALGDGPGEIGVELFYDPVLRIARLECADTGHGLTPEDKLRMFEPYYSTKEKGTGLGLAIVSSIIADHNGFIRVRDNTPRGAVIVIELPGQTA